MKKINAAKIHFFDMVNQNDKIFFTEVFFTINCWFLLEFRKYALDCLRKFVFERRRFRQFLSSLAEWCATFKEKGEEDGRRS